MDFFNFYLLNSNISLMTHVMKLNLSECDCNVLLEERVSQNFILGLSFYFISKNG